MNELTVRQESLPATLPELANFVLIGREKLASVRAEIRAIQKVGLQRGRLPIGSAVRMSSKWTYHISPERLRKYIEGDRQDEATMQRV